MASNTNFEIVSIEGNIGGGKSTLLNKLKGLFEDKADVIFLREPVDEWEQIKDSKGDSMLKKFYENQEKYSFPFQMMAYISRLKIIRDALKNNTGTNKVIIITERSLYTDKHVFAKMLHDQCKIEDVCYQIYLNWFDEFAKDYPVTKAIYVKTDPEICYQRIHSRSRIGEEVIALSYLNDCHKYHEEFLNPVTGVRVQKLILDGNVDIYTNQHVFEDWVNQINGFIYN